MKNFSILAIVAIIAIFSSCQKDEITVNLKTSGNISVQLIDSAKTTYPKVKVHLYSSYYSTNGSLYYNGEIDVFTTDDKGNVDFGTVAAGTYFVVADTIKNGNKKYIASKMVQVVSGDSKNVMLNPFEHIGNIKLNLNLYTGSSVDTFKRSKMKVALIYANDYYPKMTRSKILSKALEVKSFNDDGSVAFNNVPANITYMTYVYYNNADTTAGSFCSTNYFSVTKDNTYSSSLSVNLQDIYIIRGNISLLIEYYGNNGTTGVPKANVILVPYSDYYNNNLSNATINTIKTYAAATGVTDKNGNITFSKIPANKDYFVLVYYDESKKHWANSSVSTSNYTTTIDMYGSYLGLSK